MSMGVGAVLNGNSVEGVVNYRKIFRFLLSGGDKESSIERLLVKWDLWHCSCATVDESLHSVFIYHVYDEVQNLVAKKVYGKEEREYYITEVFHHVAMKLSGDKVDGIFNDFRKWLAITIRNKIFDILRKKTSRQNRYSQDDSFDGLPYPSKLSPSEYHDNDPVEKFINFVSPYDEAVCRETEGIVAAALDGIGGKRARSIKLNIHNRGQSAETMASSLGLTVNAFYLHVNRARNDIRKKLVVRDEQYAKMISSIRNKRYVIEKEVAS